MCLVKYKTIEEGLNAVAFLHGYLFYGRFKNSLFFIICKGNFKSPLLNLKFERIVFFNSCKIN